MRCCKRDIGRQELYRRAGKKINKLEEGELAPNSNTVILMLWEGATGFNHSLQ